MCDEICEGGKSRPIQKAPRARLEGLDFVEALKSVILGLGVLYKSGKLHIPDPALLKGVEILSAGKGLSFDSNHRTSRRLRGLINRNWIHPLRVHPDE